MNLNSIKVIVTHQRDGKWDYGDSIPWSGYLVQYDAIRRRVGFVENEIFDTDKETCANIEIYYIELNRCRLLYPLNDFFDADKRQIYDGDMLGSLVMVDKLCNKDLRIVDVDSLLENRRKVWNINAFNWDYGNSVANQFNIRNLHQDDIFNSMKLNSRSRTAYCLRKDLGNFKVISNIYQFSKPIVDKQIIEHRIDVRKKLGLFVKVQNQTDELLPDGFVDDNNLGEIADEIS